MKAGGQENIGEDTKEKGRQDILAWCGLVEPGCRSTLSGPTGADGLTEGRRRQRSILSELGSYPRGHRTGLARGDIKGKSSGAIYIISVPS